MGNAGMQDLYHQPYGNLCDSGLDLDMPPPIRSERLGFRV